MFVEVSAVKFRNTLGEQIDQVQYRQESILITKDGVPAAALIDTGLFHRVHGALRQMNRLATGMADRFAGVPVEEGIARIKALTARLRQPGSEG